MTHNHPSRPILITRACLPNPLAERAGLVLSEGTSTEVSLLLQNGRIQSIGTQAEIEKDIQQLGIQEIEFLDARGAYLLPGLNDSHMHLLGYGISLFSCNLTGITSANQLVERVQQFIEHHQLPAGSWVEGRGWNQDYFDVPVLPTRDLLDQISTEHPILLSRACGHLFATNSKALEIAGLDKTATLKVTDGAIDVDHSGTPTGIFRENAIHAITQHIPKHNKEQIKAYILAAQTALFHEGITSVQSDDLCVYTPEMNDTVFSAFKELAEEGSLKLKVYEQSLFQTRENLERHLALGYRFNEDFSRFRTGPLKILGDGSLGGRTALLSTPYADEPTTIGIAIYEQAQLNDLVATAAQAGIPSVIHAIGDGMLDMALDAISQLPETMPRLRHGIVHCQVTRPEQLERMKSLEVHALVQPIFLDYDLHMAEARLGQNRASTTYAFNKMIELGIPAAYGTDCPVEGPSVWNCIQCAVTRQDLKGYPEQGWLPYEAVTVAQAIDAYTSLGAWASGESDHKGQILSHFDADLILLDGNPYDLPGHKLSTLNTLATICHGELVWISPTFK